MTSPSAGQTVLHTFTTEISPFGQIFVGGGGGDRHPARPRDLEGSWVLIPAWIDWRNPAMLALYPPDNMIGPDIVTVEEIEGDFLGHRDSGAETVLIGRLTFIGEDPYIYVTAATGVTIRVPFEVQQDATYQVWVEVADRQEAIIRFERWAADEDSDETLPAIEHWWVTLRFLREEQV